MCFFTTYEIFYELEICQQVFELDAVLSPRRRRETKALKTLKEKKRKEKEKQKAMYFRENVASVKPNTK